jgi:3-dehydroquinate synthase
LAEGVTVTAGAPYRVVVGRELDIGELVSEALEPATGVILTDSNVGPLHAGRLAGELEGAGWRVVDTIEVPPGERSKSLSSYGAVVRRLALTGLGRDGTLFALGGGVVGDLGGFIAHTYMRGISLVQLPTSLLAMVDSSVGGKVGVDLPEGKNLVGGFLQPRAVIAEVGWLETLSDRELSCGLAEVVKMGLLCGGGFYRDLELLPQARGREAAALETLILHSVRFKASVVERDEREEGLRAILNYGHTVGHALEAAASYRILHGEAVAVGMLAEAELSRRRFGTDLRGEHRRLLEAAALPTRPPEVEPAPVLEAMKRDKKRRSGEHRFVLLKGVGEPVWDQRVEDAEVVEVIGSL